MRNTSYLSSPRTSREGRGESRAGSKGVVDLGAYRAAVAASKQATSALQDHAGTLAKLEQAAKQATAEEKGLANALANVKKLRGRRC
jgi:hypothetical protein